MSTPLSVTPAQVLSTVEQVGTFVAGFFPGAAPAVTIAEEILPAVAPTILALYNAIYGGTPANVSDAAWLAILQMPAMQKTAAQYCVAASVLPPVAAPVVPTA
jgi:hypothetical protein